MGFLNIELKWRDTSNNVLNIFIIKYTMSHNDYMVYRTKYDYCTKLIFMEFRKENYDKLLNKHQIYYHFLHYKICLKIYR